MPAYQTTYPGNLAPGYAGLDANMEISNTISRIIETAGGVDFGKPVYQGAADNGIATTGTVLRGVTLADHNVPPSNGGDKYAKGDTVPVMAKGVVWVEVASAVTAGAPAYVTSGGAFTATSSGNTAIANAIFDSAAAPGALAKLRLN